MLPTGVPELHAIDGEAWEHTALIRSILLAFARDPQRAIDAMGGRVRGRSLHLGHLLEDAPRPADDLPHEAREEPLPDAAPEARLRDWRNRARDARRPSDRGEVSVAPDGAGQPIVLTEFQAEWVRFRLEMERRGVRDTP